MSNETYTEALARQCREWNTKLINGEVVGEFEMSELLWRVAELLDPEINSDTLLPEFPVPDVSYLPHHGIMAIPWSPTKAE